MARRPASSSWPTANMCCQWPNTGGMGAYSPAPVVTAAVYQRIMDEVIMPTVRGMAAEGLPYTGFLYAGLMIDANGAPKVIEYNCRFGDPETQPIMRRLRSDLVAHCLAALEKRLDGETADWDEIKVLPGIESVDRKIFHAGTAEKDGKIVTAGGRVLCATALGDSVAAAQSAAYELAAQISWSGMFHRSDIAYRAIAREKPAH